MPATDTCISSLYEPGNIGASSGMTPVRPIVPSLPSDDYDPSTLVYSLNFSKFYNSPYYHYGEH